ncbi:homeobox-domain-containing protein, partial [Linnemannia elongata AG-77]
KKRTRASAEQLAILEDTFLTNQSPNSKVREILAKKVKMSERSIQIWFQNRRAKVKQAQKRTELVQQEAMKAQYLSNYGLPEGITSSDMMFGAGMVPTASQIPTMPTFNCDNLAIGTWRRMSTSNTDLSCFYCPTTRIMTWQIIDHAARFKMTFPLSSISRIEYYEVDPMYSQVDFDLIETPQFFMETVSEDQQRDWKKCSDFTEAKQATLVMRHTIHGLSSALKMQVMSLTIA